MEPEALVTWSVAKRMRKEHRQAVRDAKQQAKALAQQGIRNIPTGLAALGLSRPVLPEALPRSTHPILLWRVVASSRVRCVDRIFRLSPPGLHDSLLRASPGGEESKVLPSTGLRGCGKASSLCIGSSSGLMEEPGRPTRGTTLLQ